MKKSYNIPVIEMVPFLPEDVLTSSGLGPGDGTIDTLDFNELSDKI